MVKTLRICEVSLRDGMQNISRFIPTEIKISLIERLIQCGLKEFEITGFVHPKAIPQFSDSATLVNVVQKYPDINFKVLIPNLKGAERAFKAGAKEVVFVFSASEIHNMSNVKMTTDQSLGQLDAVIEYVKTKNNINVQLDLATTFGYHLEEVSLDRVETLTRKCIQMGIKKIIYCDTSGLADPVRVEKLIQCIRLKFPQLIFGFHFHDTYGTAVANCVKSVECGINILETSIAGLGGCPFAVNASGNLATEDLVWVMEKMGIHTDIDMDCLIETSRFVKTQILEDASVASRVFNAMQTDSNCAQS